MVAPVPSQPKITYPYGSLNDRYQSGYHTGDDYFAAYGARIVATRGGVVEEAGYAWGPSYGRVVVIRVKTDKKVVKCLYAHTSAVLVKKGDKVKTGQRIAKVGTSGTNTTGPHLHYEERLEPFLYNNQDRKPRFQDYVDPRIGRLTKLKQQLGNKIDSLRKRKRSVAEHLKALKSRA